MSSFDDKEADLQSTNDLLTENEISEISEISEDHSSNEVDIGNRSRLYIRFERKGISNHNIANAVAAMNIKGYQNAWMACERNKNITKNFGYIQFTEPEDAKEAIPVLEKDLQVYINGRALRPSQVDWAIGEKKSKIDMKLQEQNFQNRFRHHRGADCHPMFHPYPTRSWTDTYRPDYSGCSHRHMPHPEIQPPRHYPHPRHHHHHDHHNHHECLYSPLPRFHLRHQEYPRHNYRDYSKHKCMDCRAYSNTRYYVDLDRI